MLLRLCLIIAVRWFVSTEQEGEFEVVDSEEDDEGDDYEVDDDDAPSTLLSLGAIGRGRLG